MTSLQFTVQVTNSRTSCVNVFMYLIKHFTRTECKLKDALVLLRDMLVEKQETVDE